MRDGKVVAYCSTECARAAETKPTVMPAAIAPAADKQPEPAATPEVKADGKGDAKSKGEGKREAKVDAKVDAKAEPKAATNADAKSSAKSEPADATSTPSQTPSVQARAKSEGEPARTEKAAGVASAPAAARIADVDDTSDESPRKSRLPVVLATVVVLGGAGAFLVYKYLIAPKPSAVTRAPKQVTAPPPAVDAAPPAVAVPSAADAVTRAREVLTQGLTAGTPRIQREAAAALARTGDAAAIEVLATALATETTDAAKLELAYALARGGDKRGFEALGQGLTSPRRDTKLEAGRLLAQLGDKRAVHTLENYLAVTQLRLGTAEVLANFAEPRAVDILEKVRADEKTSPDDRARATIALGIAGRTDVTPDLHALLKVEGFNAFAASALARLRDPAARPVLVGLLAFPSLRVEAARSLRVLDPTADLTAERATLLAALASEKDTVQLQVAEALLLLAGDAAWSERP
ncbi:MAG: HEAT repeat domain-containing protein [Kofleriaceae bacterium]|nr:HEAT repeat domain-containing protein [Kofleriaceae bacterium]